MAALPLGPAGLLAALGGVAGALSAVFSNDVICLAMTPVVARLCLRRGLDPVVFLVALACAANIGSAATLIGNPQNMLIGSVLQLQFGAYLRQALPPVALALAALVGAGVLLLSRRFHSSEVMRFVDWELLILFMGLFVVNHAFEATGLAAQAVTWLAGRGVHLADPGVLMVAGVALSDLVSNVPAVMLLLPHLPSADAGILLALVSTLAGNLLRVGSIANLIVADLAREAGITIDWRAHAAIGVPVTLLTLAIAWGWLRWAG